MTDYLFLIAELAAAFAGFTAIVSVLDTRSDSRQRALDVLGVLYIAQVRRGFTREMKEIPGYSLLFARFLAGMGIAGLGLLIAGASGVADPATLYTVCATILLSVAGLQFFRLSISIMGSAGEEAG